LLLWGGLDAQRVGRELRREAEVRGESRAERGPSRPSSTQFSNAIREFQWVSQLPISGVLDPPTLHQMMRPRCGVADTDSQMPWTERVSALFAGRWAKMRRKKRFARQVSYRLLDWPRHLPEPAVRGAVRAAFQLWSNVSALEFWEAPATGPADIRLAFFQGDHNDGLSNAFDGPGADTEPLSYRAGGKPPTRRGSLERRQWRLRSSFRFGQPAAPSREPSVFPPVEWEHPSPSAHAYYKQGSRDPQKALAEGSVCSFLPRSSSSPYQGKPQGGSVAIQLPGKLFTDFEAWDPLRLQGRRPETRGPKYCHSSFDAITVDGQQRLYVFQGNQFWEVTADGNVSEPRPLRERWAGLPPHIEAAAVSLEDGDFYFFKGSRCWRFRGPKPVWGSPQLCRAGGLPRHPDAAFFFPPLRRLVLFKGTRYYVLAREGLQVEPYYPRGLRDWGGVPEEVSGALPRPDGSIIFFRDDRYWRLDQAKLQTTTSGRWATELPWMGCWHANSGGTLF
ncbi:Matrix metalloproteinase-28, partial [Bos mutus]